MNRVLESAAAQRIRDHVPLIAKRAVGRTARSYGSATAHSRPLPDFLIVGTKRGATTSLFRYLQQHPGVGSLFPSFQTMKGTYFFDENYTRGEDWYRSHFPTAAMRRLLARRAGGRFLIGESCPYYLYHPLAAERAARTLPQARILVLLRDPAHRAWSHWKASRRAGVEPLSFADALAAEPARLAGEEQRIRADPGYRSIAHRHLSYVSQGRYVGGLTRWMSLFPADRVLVLRSEDLFEHPQAVVDEAAQFLGLAPCRLRSVKTWGMHADDPSAPAWLPALDAAFVEDNRSLEELLGRPFGWTSATAAARDHEDQPAAEHHGPPSAP